MTATILSHYAKVDPIFHQALVDKKVTVEPGDYVTDHSQYFFHLCRKIVYQQLSGKAAQTIFDRFLTLFPDQEITAEEILKISDQQLRDIGMSWAKASYVRDLAEHTAAGKIRYDQFHQLTDEEIIQELTQVKGIGRWTVEMFLIFTLGREDVFSFGDLSLQKGIQKIYNIQDPKILKKKMAEITAKWSPYRSFGALALWRYNDQ
jgi:DNA-3-methyladenine glycosylase II